MAFSIRFPEAALFYLRRMDHRDACVTPEVVEIKAEDLIHLMNGHRRNNPGIVDLNPGDPVIEDKLSPGWEHFRRLG